jgi:hypothetical protein
MRDPHDLRNQAGQWRRQASFQSPQVAAALTLGARELEAQADRIEREAETALDPHPAYKD